MCRTCDQANSRILRQQDDMATAHFQAATAFPADGVGDSLELFPAPTLAELAAADALADDIPNDDSTTHTVTVDGPRVRSTINTPGDQDWFAVELVAGVTYDIGQYGTREGPTGVVLRDPLVELYDSNGNLLRSDDSGGPDNNLSDDALIIFTPEVSGTYYINARAWDTSDPLGIGIDLNPATTTGDYVGDYEVFARVSTLPPDYYRIRYETVDDPNTARDEVGLPTLDSSPLHAIDWQTQFDGTSRNPDGAEGPRVTGNEVESKIGGKNVIYYYFAREGEVFVDNAADPLNLTTTIVAKGMVDWEMNAFELALDKYEQVADIVYVETEDRYAADIVVVTYQGTPGPGLSLLGRMSPPDTPSEGQTEYNAGDERWTQEDLAPGGFYFSTLIHELGHGHGMAHPHDSGGGRASVMRGVEEESVANYTTGDFDLNQGVFTMMSYEDGWQTSPYGMPSSTAGYGFIGSLMAMDIAVIQDKYGVNEEWATGNDTYVMIDENRTTTFDGNGEVIQEATSYKSIWDAGGNDSIVYSGARNANIDLRPATLRYEFGGGGWVSYDYGIHVVFTIDNAVTIENAIGGSGNDKLTGNDAVNFLDGGLGNDAVDGGAGDDVIFGGAGNNNLLGGDGNDYINAGAGADFADGGLGNDQLETGGGNDVVFGGLGNDGLMTGDGDDYVNAGDGNDIIFAGAGDDDALGGAGNDYLAGGDGADYLEGGGGDDGFDGGAGSDMLFGGDGADIFHFTAALGADNVDLIVDFVSGSDKIALDDAAFAGLAIGGLGAGAFVIGTAAQDADDRIIYNQATGALLFDADGAGGADAIQFATVNPGITISSGDFIVF